MYNSIILHLTFDCKGVTKPKIYNILISAFCKILEIVYMHPLTKSIGIEDFLIPFYSSLNSIVELESQKKVILCLA